MEVSEGRIARVEVVRGASCGATWDAAMRLVGMTPDEALEKVGLEVQFHCKADPSNWDPLFGKSPVHFAGHIHRAALERALGSGKKSRK